MRRNGESEETFMNKKCQVFTPENYVRELLDSVGYTHNLYGKRILENSCGDGNILVAVVQRYIDDCRENGMSRTKIKNGLAKDIYGIEIDKEQYEKCINNLNDVLKRNNIGNVDWKIVNEDYLKWNSITKFQYIVGNPPYITYSELKEEEQLFVKGNFETCVKGKFDYCYAFIEKSIKSLANDGKMSYLIPSSIYKTVFGNNLRTFMCPYITKIKDYKQVKIFDKALVKSSIMVLDKQRQNDVLRYHDMSMETEMEIPIERLEEKWFFAEENEEGQHRFGDYFKVSHVVATLLNKAYVLPDGAYTEVDDGYVCGNHTIERAVVRSTETPRTLRYNKHEKIIFTYTYDEYGRSQALSGLNSQKLLISTVVTNDVDVYELEQECIPYAGMYIVEKEDNNGYTLQNAAEILRSEEFKEYVFKVGIPISGKSVRITSKDVENYMF